MQPLFSLMNHRKHHVWMHYSLNMTTALPKSTRTCYKNSTLLRKPRIGLVKDDLKFLITAEPMPTTIMGPVNFTAYDTGRDIIPVYCSILAAVIVGLVIYVTVKCWNTCKQKQQLAKARAGELDGGGEVVHADPALYSKLPPQKREEIEQLLDGPGANRADWRNLAHLLGYDEERVSTIGRGEDPAHTLLSDWSMRADANLDVLCKALGRMDRNDIIERLKSEPAVTSVV
ncbi:tumor necrosis factor receptor superfamily member 16-like isoform X3 [Mobula birostris]|uniref:tumor necrosis factor receptor superfamily member 16-like isoform X3 n=1 Tax=Mobula birostris TaxID=1983395 RepID=UPI003B281BFB